MKTMATSKAAKIRRRRSKRISRTVADEASKILAVKDQRKLKSRQEDAEMIREALSGSQDAFAKLMRKYYDSIYSLIFRMIQDKAEIDDLTQEVFIKAFTALRSFNDDYAFSTWLYKIASNNCIDHIRKRKLKTYSIDKPVESEDSDYAYELSDSTYEPDRRLMEEQQRRLIQDAIDSLPAKYRTVIVMRHNEEKSYEEIARILKLPIGTVKAHIFRAREMLNKALKGKIGS
jgi:RNA polymerase sigma factor (sigma-70 family)